MADEEREMPLGSLVDRADLEFLEAAATELGIAPETLAQELIENRISVITRPKTMAGKLQPFRRRYIPERLRTNKGLKSPFMADAKDDR